MIEISKLNDCLQSGIYAIINTIKPTCYCSIGKPYIGQSKIIGKRLIIHVRDLNNRNHHNNHLTRAWNKYGQSAFKFMLLEIATGREQLVEKENFWIDVFHSNKGFGYNQYKGGLQMQDKHFF
jgi:group I intron endonuclease